MCDCALGSIAWDKMTNGARRPFVYNMRGWMCWVHSAARWLCTGGMFTLVYKRAARAHTTENTCTWATWRVVGTNGHSMLTRTAYKHAYTTTTTTVGIPLSLTRNQSKHTIYTIRMILDMNNQPCMLRIHTLWYYRHKIARQHSWNRFGPLDTAHFRTICDFGRVHFGTHTDS